MLLATRFGFSKFMAFWNRCSEDGGLAISEREKMPDTESHNDLCAVLH